jgi:hypothetical protein
LLSGSGSGEGLRQIFDVSYEGFVVTADGVWAFLLSSRVVKLSPPVNTKLLTAIV